MNGDLLLEAMGYKSVALSTLILDGPIGPDRVITVSKDCLIAYVECQVSYLYFYYIRYIEWNLWE